MPTDKQAAAIDSAPPWVKTILDGQTAIQAEVYGMKEQLRLQNGRVTKLEARADRHSDGVDQLAGDAERNSKVDMKQDVAIANILTDVADVKGQVAALHKLATGVLQNPTVLWAGRVLVLLLAAYAANKGIKVLP